MSGRGGTVLAQMGNKMITNYIEAYDDPAHAFHLEARQIARDLLLGTYVVRGVIRWRGNGNVPPSFCVDLADHIGIMIDAPACNVARAADIAGFFQFVTEHPPCEMFSRRPKRVVLREEAR